jgi:uncharacterized membrane protein
MHSFATAIGLAAAVRMAFGGAWWVGVAWYVGSFVGIHVVMVPFVTAWYAAHGRLERWIRAIVEAELIRFDLRTYQHQLRRVFPEPGVAPEDPDASKDGL